MPQQKTRLDLPGALGASLSAGHPWVYRDHVPRGFSAPSGSILRVRAGQYSGWALWDAVSPIALRILSDRVEPSAAWLRQRVAEAWALRALVRSEDTDAFRWIFGEGDGLPGITVDVYGDTAVVITYADSLASLLEWLVAALRDIASLARIVRRHRGASRDRLELLWGSPLPSELVVREHGMRLRVDLEKGQKTGLFLDHRENRQFVRAIAEERRVLNLFSYTGAFSVAAARGGAAARHQRRRRRRRHRDGARELRAQRDRAECPRLRVPRRVRVPGAHPRRWAALRPGDQRSSQLREKPYPAARGAESVQKAHRERSEGGRARRAVRGCQLHRSGEPSRPSKA